MGHGITPSAWVAASVPSHYGNFPPLFLGNATELTKIIL